MKSHTHLGYSLEDLPESMLIFELLASARQFAHERNIRLTLHPDQFTLLSSKNERVTKQSYEELLYHAEFSELVGADVLIIHGGGAYGDKESALARVARRIEALPVEIRSRIALENDDRIYTPSDLLPLCESLRVPFVYDVHHHRCLADGLSVEEVTKRASATWDREPLFHLSSPRGGWHGNDIRAHHDYIDYADYPECWHGLELTVEVEAKAKELAVLRLLEDLASMGGRQMQKSILNVAA